MYRKNVYYECFVESDSYRDVISYIVMHIGTILKLNHSWYLLWLNIFLYMKNMTYYAIITLLQLKIKRKKYVKYFKKSYKYVYYYLLFMAPSVTWFIRRHYKRTR